MLKRDIKYEDFEGNEVTETFYFNLSKAELIEMSVEPEAGMKDWIEKVIKTEDRKELIRLFKDIVLRSVGVKSEDGKRFVKNDQIREEFTQTNAYSALFMDLATNENSAADFVKGVLPRDLSDQVTDAMDAGTTASELVEAADAEAKANTPSPIVPSPLSAT